MKVEVNHDACIGCGMCKYIDENTFEYDDKGYIIAKTNDFLIKNGISPIDWSL